MLSTSILFLMMLSALSFKILYQPRMLRMSSRIKQASMSTGLISPQISLTQHELEIFSLINAFCREQASSTTVRVAGGWVRDKIIDPNAAQDIDLAVDTMTGVEFAKRFRKWASSRKIQLHMSTFCQNPEKSKHLETARIVLNGKEIDIVNLRSEHYTETSRVPQIAVGTPMEDAMRRDITINALFYNLQNGRVEDFTGLGLKDLQAKLIRTPLAAKDTFIDDPLRMLRAIRFATRLGYRLHESLQGSLSDPVTVLGLQTKVSKERVWIEISKMIANKRYYEGCAIMHVSGLVNVLFTPFYVNQMQNVTIDKNMTCLAECHSALALQVYHMISEGIQGPPVVSNIFEKIQAVITEGNGCIAQLFAKNFSCETIVNLRSTLIVGFEKFIMEREQLTTANLSKIQIAALRDSLRATNSFSDFTANTKSAWFNHLEPILKKGTHDDYDLYLFAKTCKGNWETSVLYAMSQIIADTLLNINYNKGFASSHCSQSEMESIFRYVSSLQNMSIFANPVEYSVNSVNVEHLLPSSQPIDDMLENIRKLNRLTRVMMEKNIAGFLNAKPLLNGGDVKKLLPTLTGPDIGMVMEAQVKTMVLNPAMNREDMKTFLFDKFAAK